jgi:hypothetical protein
MDGAKIELGEHNSLRPSRDEDMIDVRNAEIAGDCNFCSWQSLAAPTEVFPFESAVEITLDAARIRNELTFAGARVKSVSAKNIEVGGSCDFSVVSYWEQATPHRFSSEGDVLITGALIKGDLIFSGAHIGALNPVEKGRGTDDEGGSPKNVVLSISGSTIGGDCSLDAIGDTSEENGATRMRGTRFECNGNIDFTESKITKSLSMGGLDPSDEPEDSGGRR